MGPSTDDCGGGTGDARFERLGMRCGVTFAEPSDSGCVAPSSLIAMSIIEMGSTFFCTCLSTLYFDRNF